MRRPKHLRARQELRQRRRDACVRHVQQQARVPRTRARRMLLCPFAGVGQAALRIGIDGGCRH